MPTRRTLLRAAALAAAAPALDPASARAQSAEHDPARLVVDGFLRQLIAIVAGPGSPAQKRQAMQPLVERAVDLDDFAQRSLGRYSWTRATPAQRQKFVALVHRRQLDQIASLLGQAPGITVKFVPTVPGSGIIHTVITRPGQSANDMFWYLRVSQDPPRIVDYTVDGTSARSTLRNQCDAVLYGNGEDFDRLLADLQRQLPP